VDGLQTEIPWKGVPERVTVPYIGLQRVNPSLVLLSPLPCQRGGGRGEPYGFCWASESGCLGMQPKAGGKSHPKLNTWRETDSEQVPRGKDEKDPEKRVKSA